MTLPLTYALTEKITSNVEFAKKNLAKLVNPNGAKEDIIMMQMFEAKIEEKGGLSDALMDTFLQAVAIEKVGIDRNLCCSTSVENSHKRKYRFGLCECKAGLIYLAETHNKQKYKRDFSVIISVIIP